MVPLSFSNRYSVRPLASTRMRPSFELFTVTVAPAAAVVADAAVVGVDGLVDALLLELLLYGLLLPHPAATRTIAAAAAAIASSRLIRLPCGAQKLEFAS